jgi:NTE family protein
MTSGHAQWMDKARRVLVLQGGGALGAYQAGAFAALCGSGVRPDWVAGISIGAINAALIAGNSPEKGHIALDTFWTRVTSQLSLPALPWDTGDAFNAALNEWNASIIMAAGVPGFFAPRVPPLPFQPAGDLSRLSIYDTAPLHETLRELVDFDRINHKDSVRISVGAVDVETGRQLYFDNRTHTITEKHIMASAALPPGFPAVKIDGRYYWDGGLASNTPLDHVMRFKGEDHLLVFQLDLFSAKGKLPTTLAEIAERGKDIRFASRTAMSARKERKLYNANRNPDHQQSGPARGAVTVLQLIYRSDVPEVASRDYNFSPLAVAEHRTAGKRDVERAMRNRDWLAPPPDGEPMVEYVLTDDDERPVRRR